MIILKHTEGYVLQVFEHGVCVKQFFYAGDIVTYENDNTGESIRSSKLTDPLYHHFDMVQPEKK